LPSYGSVAMFPAPQSRQPSRRSSACIIRYVSSCVFPFFPPLSIEFASEGYASVGRPHVVARSLSANPRNHFSITLLSPLCGSHMKFVNALCVYAIFSATSCTISNTIARLQWQDSTRKHMCPPVHLRTGGHMYLGLIDL
jgi:hypothetical protein